MPRQYRDKGSAKVSAVGKPPMYTSRFSHSRADASHEFEIPIAIFEAHQVRGDVAQFLQSGFIQDGVVAVVEHHPQAGRSADGLHMANDPRRLGVHQVGREQAAAHPAPAASAARANSMAVRVPVAAPRQHRNLARGFRNRGAYPASGKFVQRQREEFTRAPGGKECCRAVFEQPCNVARGMPARQIRAARQSAVTGKESRPLPTCRIISSGVSVLIDAVSSSCSGRYVIGAGLKSTRSLCRFSRSAHTCLRPLATSRINSNI